MEAKQKLQNPIHNKILLFVKLGWGLAPRQDQILENAVVWLGDFPLLWDHLEQHYLHFYT